MRGAGNLVGVAVIVSVPHVVVGAKVHVGDVLIVTELLAIKAKDVHLGVEDVMRGVNVGVNVHDGGGGGRDFLDRDTTADDGFDGIGAGDVELDTVGHHDDGRDSAVLQGRLGGATGSEDSNVRKIHEGFLQMLFTAY